MAFTPEQRAKAMATRKANAEKRAKDKSVFKPASMEHATTQGQPEQSKSAMQAEIDRLRAELGIANAAKSAAEQAALASAEAQGMLMPATMTEVPTGKMATIAVFDHYVSKGFREDGREILKPIFKSAKVPTYFYKIDLAPNGGLDLKINGTPLFHNGVYEMDIDTLRTVKEIVFRGWKHERDFRGTDENFYRRQDPGWQFRNTGTPVMIGGRR